MLAIVFSQTSGALPTALKASRTAGPAGPVQFAGRVGAVAAGVAGALGVATVVGVKGGHFEVRAPLLRLTKAEIIRRGVALGLDYGLTHSCYDPDAEGRACGRCDSCQLRRKGFIAAGVPDPTVYAP